jgi:hypothetical protein
MLNMDIAAIFDPFGNAIYQARDGNWWSCCAGVHALIYSPKVMTKNFLEQTGV